MGLKRQARLLLAGTLGVMVLVAVAEARPEAQVSAWVGIFLLMVSGKGLDLLASVKSDNHCGDNQGNNLNV